MRIHGPLPDKFLRLMSKADRELFAPGQLLHEEAVKLAVAKNERQLQGWLVGLLRLRGIEPLWFRTDKRTAATIGWPDITFAMRGQAIAWEAKMPGEKPRPEQLTIHDLMKANGWCVTVVTSVKQGQNFLDTFNPEAHMKWAAVQGLGSIYARQYEQQ